MVTTSLFATLFLSTLVSGWHCALMCGGIAAAIERPRGSEIVLVSKSMLFYQQLIMHLGRLTTYVLLGAAAGQIGVIVWQQNVVPIQRSLFALSALILIAMAIRLWRQQQPKPSSTWLDSRQQSSGQSTLAVWLAGQRVGLVACSGVLFHAAWFTVFCLWHFYPAVHSRGLASCWPLAWGLYLTCC